MAFTGHPDWMIEREGPYTFPRSEPLSRERLRALEAALRHLDSLGRSPAVSLPARAESSPANGCEEPRHPAGVTGSAGSPGLAT